MKKIIFIDDHQWLNMIKDYKKDLNKIKELKLDLVEFYENDIIKNKMYLTNCIIGNKNY